VTQAADDDFWERVRTELAAPRILLLEETHFRNATRWHRLTENNLDIIRIIRAALPRAPGPLGRTPP
jgi:small subunit ribosomal protein S1